MNTHPPRPRASRRAGFTLVEIMIVVLIIGVLLAIAVPSFISARENSRAKVCVSNLAHLYAASQQYSIDNHLPTGNTLSQAQFLALAPAYIQSFPVCPSGGVYAPGTPYDSNPTCNISGSAGAPSPKGVGDFAPPTASGSLAGAGRYYHGLQ